MLKIMTTKRYKAEMQACRDEEYRKALIMVREIFKNKGSIYIEPLTLVGDNQIIHDSLFLFCEPYGVKIEPKNEQ